MCLKSCAPFEIYCDLFSRLGPERAFSKSDSSSKVETRLVHSGFNFSKVETLLFPRPRSYRFPTLRLKEIPDSYTKFLKIEFVFCQLPTLLSFVF